MTLDNVLHAAIAPVLILLEVGDEAGPGNACEPSCRNSLHGASEQQGGQIQAQRSANQGNPSFHHANGSQRASHGHR